MTSTRPDLTIWPAAVNAALLGTERGQLPIPATDETLGAALAGISGSDVDAASSLLRVAAAVGAYRRCGRVPSHTREPLPPACPPDARPACSPAAAGLLRRILQGEHAGLLRTWLALAVRHDVRAPADTLHTLLDLARRDAPLRQLVRVSGGTRAAWLAALNDEWAFAIAADNVDALAGVWETGTGVARWEALQQMRQLDPERGRAMLESAWAQENPADRAGFVAILAQGLSPADEPFLESALDDRRKEVRQHAAGLLARIPSSALVARMVERARPLVALGTSALLRRPRLDVTLPDEPDASAIRDGINPKPPVGTGVGEKAWCLAQIVGGVPPATWTSLWSTDPDTLLRAADRHEWREPLVAGWLTAAERFRDEAWARALWENENVTRIEPKWGAPPLEHVFTRVVSVEHVDAELQRAIAAGRDALRGTNRVVIALLAWSSEWSDTLARAVARRLKEYAGADRVSFATEFGLRALLEWCAHTVPVSAADAFLDGWPEQSDVWQTWAPAVDTLASVLRFRNDLHLAFNEESPA